MVVLAPKLPSIHSTVASFKALGTFCYQVIDIIRPVLDGCITHISSVQSENFYNGSVQAVAVEYVGAVHPSRSGRSFFINDKSRYVRTDLYFRC